MSLMSVFFCVSEPHSGFRIAFNMFDTDGNQIVDKREFLVVSSLSFAVVIKKEKKKRKDNGKSEWLFVCERVCVCEYVSVCMYMCVSVCAMCLCELFVYVCTHVCTYICEYLYIFISYNHKSDLLLKVSGPDHLHGVTHKNVSRTNGES